MNRIDDVSEVVDHLLIGAVPERKAELAELWGSGKDRVRLINADRFEIGAFFGVIQMTEIT